MHVEYQTYFRSTSNSAMSWFQTFRVQFCSRFIYSLVHWFIRIIILKFSIVRLNVYPFLDNTQFISYGVCVLNVLHDDLHDDEGMTYDFIIVLFILTSSCATHTQLPPSVSLAFIRQHVVCFGWSAQGSPYIDSRGKEEDAEINSQGNERGCDTGRLG